MASIAKHNLRARLRDSWLIAFGVLSAILVVVHCVDIATGGALAKQFRNSFAVVWQGEWWRLVTAQFLHLDLTHLLIDVGCILLMATMLRNCAKTGHAVAVFVVGGVLGQFFGALAWRLGVTEYASLVGSSDGVHGLVYLYIASEYRGAANWSGRWLWMGATLMLVASTVYTCMTGEMAFAGSLKSPGYNHFGGILAFMVALETGLLGTGDRRGTAEGHTP